MFISGHLDPGDKTMNLKEAFPTIPSNTATQPSTKVKRARRDFQ